jgi:hypothetical protein
MERMGGREEVVQWRARLSLSLSLFVTAHSRKRTVQGDALVPDFLCVQGRERQRKSESERGNEAGVEKKQSDASVAPLSPIPSCLGLRAGAADLLGRLLGRGGGLRRRLGVVRGRGRARHREQAERKSDGTQSEE